jgi:uncharacterized membrane protein
LFFLGYGRERFGHLEETWGRRVTMTRTITKDRKRRRPRSQDEGDEPRRPRSQDEGDEPRKRAPRKLEQDDRLEQGDEEQQDEDGGDEEQERDNGGSAGGVFSELKNVASDAALAVLAPVAKKAATGAAKYAVKKAPELLEDTVKPMLEDAGGVKGLVGQAMSSASEGPAGGLLSKLTPGGGDDDDEDGGGNAGDGTGKGRRMPVQQSVDVAAPIDIVYDQWTQFEDYPKFMHRVQRVEQRDDAHVAFHAKVWGINRMWEAEIVEQRPDERIVFKSVNGVQLTGVVTFHDMAERLTRIELNIDVDPDGPIEKIARGTRVIKRATRGDLKRFKAYVEMHEDETGAWRGEIQDGEVVSESDEDEGREDDGAEDEYSEEEDGSAEASYDEDEYDDEDEDAPEEDDEEPETSMDDEEELEDEDEEDVEQDEPEPARASSGSRRRSSAKKSTNGGDPGTSGSRSRSSSSGTKGSTSRSRSSSSKGSTSRSSSSGKPASGKSGSGSRPAASKSGSRSRSGSAKSSGSRTRGSKNGSSGSSSGSSASSRKRSSSSGGRSSKSGSSRGKASSRRRSS